MKKSLIGLALVATVSVASAAPVVVVASDNFNSYASGSLTGANGGTGWAGAWTGSTGVAVAGTASPADNPMSGQALDFRSPNSNAAAQRTLATTLSSSVYVSFDFQFNGGAINTNDFLALWFSDFNGPNIGLKANCGDDTGPGGAPCTADLFARTTGSDGVYSKPLTVGQTVSVLGLLEKVSGSSTYNRYSLWVDQALVSDTAALGAANVVFNGDSGLGSFNALGFRTANLDGSPSTDSLLFDNLSVAVVPTPGTLPLALAALGLMAFGAARRRQA